MSWLFRRTNTPSTPNDASSATMETTIEKAATAKAAATEARKATTAAKTAEKAAQKTAKTEEREAQRTAAAEEREAQRTAAAEVRAAAAEVREAQKTAKTEERAAAAEAKKVNAAAKTVEKAAAAEIRAEARVEARALRTEEINREIAEKKKEIEDKYKIEWLEIDNSTGEPKWKEEQKNLLKHIKENDIILMQVSVHNSYTRGGRTIKKNKRNRKHKTRHRRKPKKGGSKQKR